MNNNDEQQPLPMSELVLCALSRTYVVVATFQSDMDVLGRQFARLAEEGITVIVVDNHSPTLIPLSVLADVSAMNNDLLIDHVNTQWFLRARSRGYRSFGCCPAQMSYALGERTSRVWLGRWQTVPVHKGFRYFFTFRNSLWLYRQPWALWKWVTAGLMRLIYIFMFSGVFVSPRKDNLKWMFRRIRAGFINVNDWDSQAVINEAQGKMMQ